MRTQRYGKQLVVTFVVACVAASGGEVRVPTERGRTRLDGVRATRVDLQWYLRHVIRPADVWLRAIQEEHHKDHQRLRARPAQDVRARGRARDAVARV